MPNDTPSPNYTFTVVIEADIPLVELQESYEHLKQDYAEDIQRAGIEASGTIPPTFDDYLEDHVHSLTTEGFLGRKGYSLKVIDHYVSY